jgi:C4-dicarboxylate-binding protein DctP
VTCRSAAAELAAIHYKIEIEETKVKSKLISLALILFAACMPAWAQQTAPIVIKFSHVTTAESPKGRAAEYFKKLAEERSKGRVKIELYPNSTLYKDKEELEALQMNAVQMLAPAPGKFGPMGIKEYEALELPYLFNDMAAAKKVTQGPVGRQLLKKLEPKGLTGLAFWDNSFREFTSNKPMHLPSDLKGLKLRIQSSKVFEAMLRNVGAIPQVMAFSEIYQGLQTGVIDGEDNPSSNIFTQKFYEVQKHMTMTNHTYHGYVVVASKKFWDGLPEDLRAILDSAMKDTTELYAKLAKEEDEAALEAIKKTSKVEIYYPTPEEMAVWRREFVKVHKEMEGRLGKDIIQAIYQATGFDPNKL